MGGEVGRRVEKGMVGSVELSQTAEIRPAAASSQRLCAVWAMPFLAARTVDGGTAASLGSFTKMPRRPQWHLWPGFGSGVKLAVLVICRQWQDVYVIYAANIYYVPISIR